MHIFAFLFLHHSLTYLRLKYFEIDYLIQKIKIDESEYRQDNEKN